MYHFDLPCDFRSYPGLLDIQQRGFVFSSIARALITPFVITRIAASPAFGPARRGLWS
jgi:hypothetical protein